MGVELAKRFDGEVVSADSMQIYRRMDIGTAKPTPQETQGIPHHMIDVAEPWEDYSVARYVQEAVPVVEDIRSRGKLPIVVGGTGLYIDSLVVGRSFAVQATGWREKLQARAKAEGLEPLRQDLERIDQEAAGRIGLRDEKRIIRALEVWYESGKTITQHNRETQAQPPRYEGITLGLNFADRADLWRRIDRRVDEMMARGLVEEVRSLLEAGVPRGCTAMQAIGYKELVTAVETGGDLTLAAEEVKLRSRQYAKRQLTWFRRNQATHWIQWGPEPDFEEARQAAAKFVEGSGL
jgi:tRNA dimethylallyltransferase